MDAISKFFSFVYLSKKRYNKEVEIHTKRGFDMIEFKDLPMHAILLAPSYTHSALRMKLLQDKQGIMGLNIMTLNNYLRSFLHQDPKEELVILLQYRDVLTKLSLNVYDNIKHTLDFLKQCHTYIEEMKLYGITPEQLPTQSEAQKEMKDVLTLLYPMPTNQDDINEALEILVKKDIKNVYILAGSHSMQDHFLYEKLRDAGAEDVYFPNVLETKQFYHAVNKRKEVEAAAQHILTQKLHAQDINLVVCDPSYKPLLKQIFERYHIPFTILKEQHTSILTKRFILLLKYYMHPNTNTLLEVFDANTFPTANLRDLVEYLQVFQKDIFDDFDHIEKGAQPSELISTSEIKRLAALEERAREVRDILLPQLKELLDASCIRDVFTIVNTIATASIRPTDTQKVNTLKQLQAQLVVLDPYMHTKEDLKLAIDVLDGIGENASGKQLHGVLITDLSAPLPPRKFTFILGCTQKVYPAFPSKKGLFDEAYVKGLPAYPTMKNRFDLHTRQLQEFLLKSETLLVSYPLGTYEGKGNEAALEMEEFMNTPSLPFPLIENYRAIPVSFTLREETAQQLFIKDGCIHGSISAFEKYGQCPFSYFLTYGLRLREPIDYSFSQSRIGTLSHYVLETLVKRYGKAYVDAQMSEIDALLTQELQSMANVYPSFAIQIQTTLKRMEHAIAKNMEYLKDMEEHSHLAPFESEYEFWWSLPIADDLQVRLHGFIDRIDASEGYLRILDYKSSTKSLSEDDVFAGLQLQLITYALLAEKTFHKSVLGTYYYSLKNNNINCIAGKMTRRPVAYVPFGKEEYDTQQKASKRMRGWTMHEDVDIIDDDATHIMGIRQNKDGIIKARNTYDLDVLNTHFQTIYQTIGTQIKKGHIACEPIADACMFCPYGDICRFKGYPRTVKPLVEVDETIYKGGES